MKQLITETVKQYYALSEKINKGVHSPTEFVEFCVAKGHSKNLSIEVMMCEFDLTDDEDNEWLHELRCAKLDLLWSEIEDTADALGLTLTGQWSNHSDEYNIDVSF